MQAEGVEKMAGKHSNKLIESYVTGRSMRESGMSYTPALKLFGPAVQDNAWRRAGHRLFSDDFVDILERWPEVLVVQARLTIQYIYGIWVNSMKIPSP